MNSNLATHYMGLELRSPIVVAACTLSDNLDNIARMAEAGAGAVVLFSLFEERLAREEALLERVEAMTTGAMAEASNFLPAVDAYRYGSVEYLELIRKAKERVDVPIIASLNGVSPEGWIDYARQMQSAGADAIELNIFFIPADIEMSGVAVEQRYLKIVHRVTSAVDIPVAMKINPYLSATAHVAQQMSEVGAQGLVLFNRLYQPDFDIERLTLTRDLKLSEPHEIRLPLMWIAALHGRIEASLAATTGVQGGTEVIKYLLAGADVVMTATALYRHGIEHLRTITHELRDWMERKQFATVDGFRGVLSQRNVADPSAYERANYIRILAGASQRAT